ncbi:hypothetical protein BP00DRAFT_93071 [Aspergillus indologenus CBS 114.80]|uniref:Uncharacterized protein n=1 Tax=Aspergillus indologenus CBS 114.80 TaxID=1450541 RepID=A0A2V5HU61_9EURO|nr:hypothetical protein BP00DRAFT_93071 [Aspergillus indologenus CBS 114.80]
MRDLQKMGSLYTTHANHNIRLRPLVPPWLLPRLRLFTKKMLAWRKSQREWERDFLISLQPTDAAKLAPKTELDEIVSNDNDKDEQEFLKNYAPTVVDQDKIHKPDDGKRTRSCQ